MKKLKNSNLILSIALTLSFIMLGFLVFEHSYSRFVESVFDLWNSLCFYIHKMFNLDYSGEVSVLNLSKIIEKLEITPDIPVVKNPSKKWWMFFLLLFYTKNFDAYLLSISNFLVTSIQIITIILPIFFLFPFLIKKIYSAQNNKYNEETKPLLLFKKIEIVFDYIAIFIKQYINYLKDNKIFVTLWIIIWSFNLNLVTIAVEFIAYYLYFCMSFDFSKMHLQIVKLNLDLKMLAVSSSWLLFIPFIFYFIYKSRVSYAINKLHHMEACDCGYIKDLPIVSLACGSMGKKKTTLITDMAITQEAMFRQEAHDILYRNDMKFPNFPWILFEKELQACMMYGSVYNLATCKKWVNLKRERFEKHHDPELQLYGYNIKVYATEFDSKIGIKDLFDVLLQYAQAYFIYIVKSSLIFSNYSIRSEGSLMDSGNFPIWDDDFFDNKSIEAKYSHILNFDLLRLGKKVVENARENGSFEFGVIGMTEIGKERQNSLELTHVKKNDSAANQKNDLFNSWLKMCRHSSTVDNYPFVKVFTDEQRPESWGVDARALAEVLTIKKCSDEKVALPGYNTVQPLYDYLFNHFSTYYYEQRFLRGDTTLLMYLVKNFTSALFRHNLRVHNLYGYSVLKIETEEGNLLGIPKTKKYYLINQKIYSNRFSTDCYSDYFNSLACKSEVGINDIPSFENSKATVEELLQENSYFMNELYGNAAAEVADSGSARQHSSSRAKE